MGIKSKIETEIIKGVLRSASSDSNKSLLTVINISEKIIPKFKDNFDALREMVKNNHPSLGLVKRITKNIDPHCRDKLIENLIINGIIHNYKVKDEYIKQGSFSPTTVLISPTMRCNLKCVGCYANKYTMKDEMDPKLLNRIIKEGKEMGVGFFTILGGEPLVYKPLFDVFEKNNDTYFQFYTNGTLITPKVVEQLKKVGNAMPMLSIEGYEEHTDARRGKGVHQKVLKAMDMLREAGIPFGYSVAVTNKNADIVMEDEFIDMIIKKGAYVGWYFLYMPVGGCPDLGLMPTPKQRLNLLKKGEHIRATKPLFIIDFWNDAPYVGGCIAGKEYIHITHKGDVEPCIFTHFAADNIKNKSLQEVMKSKFFRDLRKKQPYNDNLYLPCMWIDNPEVSREFVKGYGVYPTHEGADKVVVDKKHRAGIDKYSKEVKKLYAKPWKDFKKKYKY